MKNKMIIAVIMLIGFLPNLSHALCLNNCQQQQQSPKRFDSPDPNSGESAAGGFRYRERSNNTGDVKNSVMGDMNIRVGHEKVDIRMDSKSNNNTVDASVSSIIILGDTKK